LKLDGLIIRNGSRNENRTLNTPLILLPGQYIAISPNVTFLVNTYSPPADAMFLNATIPAMNVSDANITLMIPVSGENVVIDSFDYSQKYHYSLIDNTKGVSLEKIDLNGPSNDPNNWHSASQQVNWATPGYKNSNQVVTNTIADDAIKFSSKSFSPNGDGFEDLLLIQYELEKSGYLATIKIYDAEGFIVRDLVDNFLVGTEGFVKWDGVDNEGRVGKVGMYIVQIRLFHPDGETRQYRKVAVLADRL
jgi:hypothetical protein